MGNQTGKFIVLSLLLFTCQTSKTPSLEDQLKSLHYTYHRASDVPYFSKDHLTVMVDSLHDFYITAIKYYEKNYDTEIPIKMAYLLKDDYNKLNMQYHPYYGIPFLENEFLILPVENKGLVFNYLEIQLKNGPKKHLRVFEQTHPFNAAGVASVMHITAVHEIGRYLQKTTTLPDDPKWLSDFISSYLLIDFLKNNYPSYNAFVNAFCYLVTDEISPVYKGLDEFEEMYMQDEHSYSWYQSKIHLAAYKIYQQEGIDLFYNYQKHAYNNGNLIAPLDTLEQHFNR